jgi:cell wall assembly regulator SMI1
MVMFKWETLLREFSQKLIEGEEDDETSLADRNFNFLENQHYNPTPEMISEGWLGFPGATAEAIQAAEARLGLQFPPSYREFLQVSNGWPRCDWSEINLWSTQDIDWFTVRNQDWIDAWDDPTPESEEDDRYFSAAAMQNSVSMNRKYLKTALEISSNGNDGDIFLLIPEVVFPDTGEWEAWHFGNKLPGARRYRSFYALFQNLLKQGRFIG